MFNQSHTILLVTRQVLARIDLSGKRHLSVNRILTEATGDHEALVPQVLRALKLGKRRAGRVTIVSPEFWTNVLSIPADVSAIASESELCQALALEAEVDSGLSAFDSRTNIFPIAKENDPGEDEAGEDDQWCVTQISTGQIHELSQALRACGSRLHAVTHPITAQLSLVTHVSADTIESYLDSWRESNLNSSDSLQEFASDWAECLSKNRSHPMLILGEVVADSNTQPITVSAVLALLAVGGCGLWHWQTQKCLAVTTQAIERLEKQKSEHESMQESLKSTEASVAQLRQEIAKAHSVRQATERQLQLAGATHSQNNARWSALIDALAVSASEDCWVQKIESSSAQTVVHGLALDNAAANAFAGRLELALNGAGWRTKPAATALSSHSLIAFKIVLTAKLKPNESVVESKISTQFTEHTPISAASGLARSDGT